MSSFFTKGQAGFDEVSAVPVPPSTATYHPIPFSWLIDTALETARSQLGDHVCSFYSLSKDRQKVFGVHYFEPKRSSEFNTAIGFVASYDKTITTTVFSGGVIRGNLSVFGAVIRTQKQTLNARPAFLVSCSQAARAVDETAFSSFYDEMSETPVSLDDGFGFLGVALGRGVFRHAHFKRALARWETSPKDAWALYRSCLHGLKGSTHKEVIRRHRGLHLLTQRKFGFTTEGQQKPVSMGSVAAPEIIRKITKDISHRFRMLGD